ncbi:hypothetical protein HPP92_015653 [Vanilla planifolia]|uniref:Uncharacterized protein n=1 Tax=Vanilla planifolia TaxID=51239 RepID=A0A835QJ15_VANPL|nr:hypothetical protein HPP92_016293 [Vanilla planifolia]KAG0471107.1 hypothetical protein HPP92_015653 [Vanilla planifolia]
MGNCMNHHAVMIWPANLDRREVMRKTGSYSRERRRMVTEQQRSLLGTPEAVVPMSFGAEDGLREVFDGPWQPTLPGIPELPEW